MPSLAKIALLVLLAADAAAATPLTDLMARTREARLAGDKPAWLRLVKEVVARTPDHPDLLLSLARAAAANDDRPLALATLARGIELGASYGLETATEFVALKGDPEFERLAQRDRENGKPVARARVFAVIPEKDFGPEGITHDAAGSRFLMGSIKGAVWQVDSAGKASPFVQPSDGTLMPVLGLKVDRERKLLWVVNTQFPDFPPGPAMKPGTGVAAVNVYDLEKGTLRARHVLDERPVLHGFNDVALAANGDAFVTDSTAGTVYRIDGAQGKIVRFHHDDEMTLPNGLALSADGRLLYVAHVEGISAIDLATRKRRLLATSRTMALGSIDGLAVSGRSLLGIQPSPFLQRVIRIDLDPTGLKAERVTVLDARSHPHLQQATGVVVDDAFYVTGRPVATAERPDDRASILRIPLR